MNLGEREQIALETLEKISKFNFVLVGGYAVNAYVPPRFSVDCNIVVLSDLKNISAILIGDGYKLVDKDSSDYVKYLRYVREIENVSFDLMLDTVFDRLTKITFDRTLFEKYSSKRTIVGRANPIRIDVSVANPELLFAMKFITARKQDIRDIFMLAGSPSLDWKTVELILAEKCSATLINNRIKLILGEINSAEYRKSLEGAFGGMPDKRFLMSKENLSGFLEGIKAD